MDDYTYQSHSTESGEHILVFVNGVFERKVFVPVSEHRMESLGWVLGEDFRELFRGTHEYVLNWLERNQKTGLAKMVAVGKDFQLLSVSEYKSLHN